METSISPYSKNREAESNPQAKHKPLLLPRAEKCDKQQAG
jgi:hypothetical protein